MRPTYRIFAMLGMWIISIFIIPTFAHAIPSRITDGHVEFAMASVNGISAWTDSEKTELIDLYGSGNIINYTPTNYEVNLSTCLVINIDGKVESGFANYTEWISCQTKIGLKRKIRKLRELIDSMSDLPASETAELRQRAGWVRSYYLTLP